jgi:FPC/CPF motif-containing protein YcgG
MKLLIDKDHGEFPSGWKLDALQKFESKITAKEKPFPCIPATQGFSLDHLRYGFVGDPREISTAQTLAILLKEYTKFSQCFGDYTSLLVFFSTPQDLISSGSVEYFEKLFWEQLNIVSNLDQHKWPEHIPTDPSEYLWEYCFHDEPYFIFCATPLHEKRYSRHFQYMMLALTPRSVLQKFNVNSTRAEKVKAHIRKRLEAYDSLPVHPNLNKYGNTENHEWKQYFLHDDDTTISKCPFHRDLNSKEKGKESQALHEIQND